MSEADSAGNAISDRARIVALLRTMLDRGCLLDAQLAGDGRSFLTAVLAADDAGLVLDTSPDAALDRRVGAGARLSCRTRLDSVPVRFDCGPCRLGVHEGREAFVAPLPELVVELQRREFYRLELPPAAPLQCTLGGLEDGGEFVATVVDLSAGGLGLRVPAGDPRFRPGLELARCRMDLPDEPDLRFGLRIVRLAPATFRGAEVRLAGCQFQQPGNGLQRSLNRYVMRLERERAALARRMR
ncbi:flagellar brake protein [Coralloluteibacterium thermophilus]|uniref:Flagellar brake protein YcgR n=1 Tax=Coralloluteibacterium thermophilum TaxID=2707049 RepID=A0ABV9NL47_9GAMM